MLKIALVCLMAAGVGAQATPKKTENYYDAYERAEKEDLPLVVVVGADWCAACKKLKRNTIAPMKENGQLKGVVLTTVDLDKEPELAEQIMSGKSLPQVIVFAKGNDGWKRFSSTGLQSKTRVRELIRKAEAVMPSLKRG